MPPSALDLSTDHLRTLSELHAALRQDAVESDAASLNPLALSRENIRRTKRLLLDVQKLRRSPRTHAVHTRSHTTRLALEKVWEQHLLRLSSTLVGQMDLDSAITAAHKAWITPPEDPVSGVIAGNLGDLVVKFFKIRKARKLDKITDSAPTADDKAAIKAWGGQRGGMGGLAMMSNDPSHIRILRDEAGKPIAVASVGEEKGVLNIRILASAPDAPGAGRTMMQMLAKEAGGKNLGIALVSTNGSEGFYDRIGMTKTENIRHSWTPAQVQAFAATAGVLAPPGARNPGLSATENAGAQQLALNALQGVPEGQRGTAADVKAALTSTVNEDSWVTGGATNYIGLATQTAEQAGQVSLDHLGLHQTFEFANPQNMAQDTFGVRGSKVIQNMYGDHVDKLTQIITDATDPRNPKTISEVKASIREQWPDLQKYQVERIARTETAAVWTTTAANAYAANGISSFETIVASGPSIGIESEDPCDECVEMAADTHSIDDDLPPWHPNCRCEAIPVLEDEDGTPWLPPDEPWTGGADGAAPVDGYVGRTAPSPGDQASQYVEADLQHLDPKLAVEDPIPAKYQKTIDQLGLSRSPRDMPKGVVGERIYGDANDSRELWQRGWSYDENGTFVPGTYLPEREALHEDIYDAHFNGKELPPAGQTPQALYTAGGGASGKGKSMFNVIIDGKPTEISLDDLENRNDFIVIDPDKIKKMLPEYKALIEAGKIAPADGLFAAAGVHEESSDIAKLITEDALSKGYNVVIDTTGSSMKFLDKIANAKDRGYTTQVTMMSAPTNDAIVRSILRAQKEGGSSYGRYVSTSELQRAHRDASKMMPAWQGSSKVDSWRVFDNSGGAPELIAHGAGKEQEILDQQIYDKVRAKALQTPDTVAASADFGTTGASPGSDAVYDKLVAPLRDDPAATQQANAAKTIGDNTTPPAPDELVLAPSWKMLDVSGKTYHADAGLTWAYEHNGIIVRIETGSMDKGISFQQAQRYQEAVNANLDSWSASQVEKLKSVTYSQGTSPWDEEFARMAGMPNFLAAAEATKDSIYVWQGARYAGRQDIFDHEMGHVLGVNHGAPLPLVWQGARADDAAEGGRYLSYSGNWNGSGDSVSEYGSTDPREDWAESVRLYMADKRFGYIGEGVEKGVPGGAIKVRFADVWPNRAALINKWLFGPGPTNQTLIDSIDKQIEGFQARLAREMKLRGNAQAEANISVIERKLTQLQTTRLEAGGDTFSTQDAAILKAPHAYLDAAPEGAVITIPDAPGSTAYAGQWTKTADGWEQGTRKMQSAALDVVTAAALTIALPGPHLGLGIMADVVAWSIFAAQLQGYMGGVSLLGHPVLSTPSPEKAKRDALAARVGLAPPPPKPSAPRRRRSS